MMFCYLGSTIKNKQTRRPLSGSVEHRQSTASSIIYGSRTGDTDRGVAGLQSWGGPSPPSVRSGNFPLKTRHPAKRIGFHLLAHKCFDDGRNFQISHRLLPRPGRRYRGEQTCGSRLTGTSSVTAATERLAKILRRLRKHRAKMCSVHDEVPVHTGSKRKDQLQAKNKYTKGDP